MNGVIGVRSLTRARRGRWMSTSVALVVCAGVAGCGSDPTQTALVVGPPAGLAVVGSDFTTTRVSLVTPDGKVANPNCIDSGTNAGDKLSLALSGDVTLPSQQQRGRNLWLVDRGNASLTVLTPADCKVVEQISVSTDFKSNPHDVAVVSDSKAYVTRFETNATPTDANSKGDDVLILDPTTGTVAGRIDLSSYAAPVEGATIQARPDRMVIADGKVFVTLASQSADFKSTGEGRVVVIDPDTNAVTTTIALSGLKGCSAMFVLASEQKLFVSCGGSFSDADQATASGVAMIDLAASQPAVAKVVKASQFDGQPVNFSWVAATSSTSAFTSTLGSFPDKNHAEQTKDGTFAFDPASSSAAKFGPVWGPYNVGRSALAGTTLFIPDADAAKPRIHAFDASASPVPTLTASFEPDFMNHMPPREIAWY